MLAYSRYPFLRLLIALVIGILAAEFITLGIPYWIYLACILASALFVWFAPPKIHLHHKRSASLGISLQLFFLITGYALAEKKNSQADITDLSNASGVVCRITQTPVAKTKSFKSEAFIQYALLDSEWVPVNKKMILYCPLASSAPFVYDEIVFIKSTITRPKPPLNPYQFNYKRYLEKKDVFYQSYVKKEDVLPLGMDHQFTLNDFEEECVQYSRNVFYSLIPDSNLSAVATALLVGYQEELDPETKTNFSRVGAMHILAVSGLHVGVIFIMLSGFLFFLDRSKYTRILKAVILIIFLWGYAIIAGFSPSIVRASLMFTFLIPIRSFNFPGNAYNNIASSAFLLLLYNTNYLFDVGFQLSYVAVLGIIYLYPLIKDWINSKYWLVDQVWQLTAVSIAATIFTFPIVLYNFGQFPVSFLVSNLIAVPVSTFIIYVGIGALILFKLSWFNLLLSKLLHGLLWVLNWSINWVESLPYSYLDHLLINRFQAFVLYALTISIILYFQYRKYIHLRLSLVLIVFFIASIIHHRYEILQHKELYIYNMNKTSYIEFVDGHRAVNVMDQSVSEMNYGLFIRTNHQHVGVFSSNASSTYIQTFLPGFQIGDTRFFVLNKFIPYSNKKINTDYLVLSEINYLDTNKIKGQFEFKEVILLNNHPVKKLRKYEELLVAAGIPFYSVEKQGAFRLKF